MTVSYLNALVRTNIERRKHHQIAVEQIPTTLQHEDTRQGPSTRNKKYRKDTNLILAMFKDPELHDFQITRAHI